MNAAVLDEADGRYLRQAIALSAAGSARGNRPFGAVVVAVDGRVLAEAHNDNAATGDCTITERLNASSAARIDSVPNPDLSAAVNPNVSGPRWQTSSRLIRGGTPAASSG